MTPEASFAEQRQYVRMSTVFPVEVESVAEAGEKVPSVFFQGFTRDISVGGMCLEIKLLGKGIEERHLVPDAKLALTINTPFEKEPIRALARIAWLRRQDEPLPVRYLIGAAYTEIDDKARRRIFEHAKRLLWIPRLVAAAGLVMTFLLIGLFINNQHLILENKRLVNRLIESAERKSAISSKIYGLEKKRSRVAAELAAANRRIEGFESSLALLNKENASQKAAFEKELTESTKRQARILAELNNLQAGSQRLETAYHKLKTEEKSVASSGLRQMVEWLQSHQNLRSGLVASFEGDASLEDSAFTYDQALACQVFLIFGDHKAAERILAFYESRAGKDNGAYFDAYGTIDGQPYESTVHTGPTIWLGIAALQYEHRIKDGRFIPLAKSIGDWAIRMQDVEGGLKGGPAFAWYSTEHNLDAYALFHMLTETTHEPRYQGARDKTLAWIKKYAYSVQERRINRGKGDSTIATDTFSWAIAALGPETLKEIQFDAEAIIQYAEEHCEVLVSYKQPSGKIASARGFDFAKAGNVSRGGIISTEWTAQMIVTYEVLARYFNSLGQDTKAKVYSEKADFFLNELQKLMITSPSRTGQGRGCLPYASLDNADTGHGWRTPKGSRTGSVAGTAYGIFAWVGYNPFDLDHDKAAR